MNRVRLFLCLGVAILMGAGKLQSQAPASARTPLQNLQSIRAANQKTLEQQAATLLKLEEIQKDSQQLRILARRT